MVLIIFLLGKIRLLRLICNRICYDCTLMLFAGFVIINTD